MKNGVKLVYIVAHATGRSFTFDTYEQADQHRNQFGGTIWIRDTLTGHQTRIPDPDRS